MIVRKQLQVTDVIVTVTWANAQTVATRAGIQVHRWLPLFLKHPHRPLIPVCPGAKGDAAEKIVFFFFFKVFRQFHS